MAKPLIFALHGFLGKPEDWNSVISGASEFDFVTGELFGREEFSWPDFSNRKTKKYLWAILSAGGWVYSYLAGHLKVSITSFFFQLTRAFLKQI